MRSSATFVLASVCVSLLCLAGCSRDVEQAKREYVERGDRYINGKNIDAAIIEYRNAIQQDPRFADAYQKLAAAYMTRGDVPDALRAALMAADLLPETPDAQVTAGDLLLLGGRFVEARMRAQKALAKDPHHVRARVLLGNATAGLKDIDSAIEEFEQAIRLDPEQSGIYIGLAALKATQGEREAAEKIFQQAIATDPSSVTARLALAQFYWSTERLTDAERTLTEAHEATPDDPRVNVSLAVFYQGTRRPADAEPYLRAAATANASPRLAILLADYYIGRNRLAEAAPLVEPLVADRRFGALASMRLARIAQIRGDSTEALRIIEATLTIEPRNAAALAVKADVLGQLRKLDDALQAADAAVAADRSSVEAHFARGRALTAKGRFDLAENAFEAVLRLNPRTTAARVHLARLRLRTDTNDAVTLATQATQLDPRSIDARLTLARALVQKQAYGEAQPILDELLRTGPDAAEVHSQMGALLARKRDLIGARAAFSRALELAPLQLEAIEGITAVEFSAGRQHEAIARLDRLVRQAPTNIGVLMTAAAAYASSKRFGDAESLLVKVIEADPTAMDAYSMLGGVYLRQNRLGAARSQFQRVADTQERPVAALTVVGIINLLENRTDDARTSFERVLKIDPRAGVAANNLAWIYAEHGGSLDLALQLAEVAKSALPDQAEVNDTLGWIYYRKGMAEPAVAALRRSLELDPSNATVAYHLALAYEKSGDVAQLRRMLTHYLTLDSLSARSTEVRQRLAATTGT